MMNVNISSEIVLKLYSSCCRELIINNIKFDIKGVSTFNEPIRNTIVFINIYSKENIDKINNLSECFIILKKEYADKIETNNNIYVFCDNPRYEYANIMNIILSLSKKQENKLFEVNGSYICENTKIHDSVLIEPGCYIGNNVEIGPNSIIMTGAKIRDNVIIGNSCIIRENSVVGGFGFGFEHDESGNNYRIPHIGGVLIKDNVEIGALTTVCSGTIEPTVIEEYTKIDDHVHIAHNCKIGRNSMVTACAEVSGSVKVGENCWIAPNSCIRDQLVIGDRTTVGLGAVVTKSIEKDNIVVGNPARSIVENK